MTKGGKKRRAPARSDSQNNPGKYVPQFNKRRKLNTESDENVEPIQERDRPTAELKLAEEEKTEKVGYMHFLAHKIYTKLTKGHL